MSSYPDSVCEAAVPPYRYSGLTSSNSIRLIELKTDVTSPWSNITLSMKTIDNIQQAPDYDALSYTWGYALTPYSRKDGSEWGMDAVRRYPIIIDGQVLDITTNLLDALHALANTDVQIFARKSKYIWIDSICINQEDLLERAAQVSIMGSIYETAQTVIVWLGNEDEFTDDALANIRALSMIPRHRHSEVKASDWYRQGVVLRRLGARPDITLHMWLGLIAFLNRPWFKRAWIVQEVGLAKHAVIVCGRKIIPWSMLSNTIAFVTSTTWHEQLSSDSMRSKEGVLRSSGPYRKLLEAHVNIGMTAVYVETARSGMANYGHKALFRWLITVFRYCEASDPRDMIYAFLGIAWQERPPFTTHPKAIVPDYQKSVCEVYTKVAITMAQSYKDLRFLSHVQNASLTAIHSLPSWVPDYSVEPRPAPLSTRVQSWKASGNLLWNHESGYQEPGLLNVTGFQLDGITDVVTYDPDPNDYSESLEHAEYWICVFELVRGLNGKNPGRRTLLTDTYNNEHPAPDSCGTLIFDYMTRALARTFVFEETEQAHGPHDPDQEKWWPRMTRAWQGLLDLEPEGSPFSSENFEDHFNAVIERQRGGHFRLLYRFLPRRIKRVVGILQGTEGIGYPQLFTIFERDLRYTGSTRRLFRTAKGYLGVGVKSLQPEDEVWIIGGADTPMLLRKHPNGLYRLVGEAYVHGIMYGEAVQSDVHERLQQITLS